MSTLISSAVGGKKAAAPKGAVRRRQAPLPGAPEKAAAPIAVSSTQNSVAPPSPPPIQPPETAPIQSTETAVATSSQPSSHPAPARHTPIPTPSATAERAAPAPSPRPVSDEVATWSTISGLALPAEDVEQAPATVPATSKKRKQATQSAKETAPPTKKAKRSSIRSNDKAQAATREDEPSTTQTVDAQTTQRTRSRQQEPSMAPANDALVTEIEVPKTRSAKQAEGPRFQLTPPAGTKKRQAEAATDAAQAQPTKRAKKSYARSNNVVQAEVEQDVTAAEITAVPSKTTQKARSKSQKDAVAPTTTPAEAPAKKKDQNKAKEVAPVKEATGKQKDLSGPEHSVTKTKESSGPQKTAAKTKSKRKATATATIPAAEEVQQEPVQQPFEPAAPKTQPKRKYRPRKKAQAEQQQSAGNEQEAPAEDEEDEESDPELHEIDPNTVTMWEVGGNKRHGKTSARERKMAEINWKEVKEKRRADAARIMAGEQAQATSTDNVVETTEGPSGTAESREGREELDELQMGANGEIVENPDRQVIDTRAEIEKEIAEHTEPIVEDIDLTARINRTTYLNSRKRDPVERVPMWKAKSDPWSEEETERFYEALRMWGTDFFIISKMFPPKTRRQIKMKFVREERLDPIRVDRALGLGGGAPSEGRRAMDLEHYANEVGQDVSEFTKFNSLEEAQAEIRESFREQEEADALAKQAQEKADKEAAEENGRRQKDGNRKTKKPRAPRKNPEGAKAKKATEGEKETGGGPGQAKTNVKVKAGNQKGKGRLSKNAKANAAATPAPAAEMVEVADG